MYDPLGRAEHVKVIEREAASKQSDTKSRRGCETFTVDTYFGFSLDRALRCASIPFVCTVDSHTACVHRTHRGEAG